MPACPGLYQASPRLPQPESREGPDGALLPQNATHLQLVCALLLSFRHNAPRMGT